MFAAGDPSACLQLAAAGLICGSELSLNDRFGLSHGSGCDIGALEGLVQGSLQTLIPIFLSF